MNPRLDHLHAYPFERLRRLLAESALPAGLAPLNLGIGEPQHATPPVVTNALIDAMPLLGKYPPTAGTPEVRASIRSWLHRRYGVAVSDQEVIPVAGSREALYAFAQAVLDPSDPGVVLMPNPFYQIYEGAAIMAGAAPCYVPAVDKPDWSAVPAGVWGQVKLVYVCSPGNPTGAVFNLADWAELFNLADHHGFVIASDECYSEIFNGAPPVGALQACAELGRSFERVVVFNSLSKRSSCPGLRSGFVAGDAAILAKFLLYRTYQGCAPSLAVQAASVAAWDDDAHVDENRAKYQMKFASVVPMIQEGLPASVPEGGFFLWLRVPGGDDEGFARRLYEAEAVTVLPGSYLARNAGSGNPGAGFVRIALVPEVGICDEAIRRIHSFIRSG